MLFFALYYTSVKCMARAASGYIPIHHRSQYSLLAGILSPLEICRWAAEQGFPGIAMTDINNFYGLLRFFAACRNYSIKPLCGAEIVYRGRSLFTAYCLDRGGFSRLCRCISRMKTSAEYLKALGREAHAWRKSYNPLTDFCENGWDGLAIISGDREVLRTLCRFSRENLFAALVYGRPYRELFRWAADCGIAPVAVNTAAFVTPLQRNLADLLRAVDRNVLLCELSAEDRLQDHHAAAGREAVETYFSAVPESLRNNREIFERSDPREIIHENYVFPQFKGFQPDESYRLLRSLCMQGVSRRYGGMNPQVSERLEYELRIIRKKNFSDYFLTVHDIVRRRPRTCGRGSSAASIVSYLLGITHVDPLQYNLFFERFLNMGRSDPPDIDVDFPWDEREEALEYVFRRYRGRAGMVADHVTFGPRSCIREPAKAFGIEEGEIANLVGFWRTGRIKKIPAFLARAASAIRKIPRHIGTHPGGVVITPQPIWEYTHIEVSPLGLPVIAWEKDAAEDAGLVKIDLLGNRSLAVLRDTLELVNKKRSEPIQWEAFQPNKDSRTRKYIESGETMGIFYIESPATRQLLHKMRLADFPHLVVASSIIRPAANRYINEYVARLHGKPCEGLTQEIDETLAETHGIMVYQEDVSRVAIAAAGFSAAEADGLRKVLSRKDRDKRLAAYRERFYAGCRRKAVRGTVIDELWNMILSFDGYSFCKSHSASYAMLSYKLAYLKCRYPLEFLCSVINNGGGFYSRQVYLNMVRRLGFEIRGPDVNKSCSSYTVEDGTLRIGLGQIRELPAPFLHKMLDERSDGGPFTGLKDFIVRTDPSYAEIRMLVRSGSLDSIAGGLSRPQMFWYYMQLGRAGEDELIPLVPQTPSCIGDYRDITKVHDELKTLDLIISRHALEIFQPRIDAYTAADGRYPCIDSSCIKQYKDRVVRIPGIMVTGKEVLTKHRDAMSFVSFEDPKGVFETVVFPGRYRDLEPLLDFGRAFIVSGTVCEDAGAYSIRVEDLFPLNRQTAP